jgi:hypothetical protein
MMGKEPGTMLKSKKHTGRVNKLLSKVIAHNLMVLIGETNESSIMPNFDNKS